MCANDSPSQKRDGASEEYDEQIDPAALTSDYADSVATLETTPLPATRTSELAAQCEAVGESLRADGAVAAAELWQVVRLVAEAIGDVESATVVTDEAAVPDERAVETGVPSEAYVVTVAERERCLAALAGVLFTVVETPAVEGCS